MTFPFQDIALPTDISKRHHRIKLKPVEETAGFDIFEFYSGQSKVKIGDDADFLKLFTLLAAHIPGDRDIAKEPVVFATDAEGKRLFARSFSVKEKEKYKYAYIALGAAAKALPENTINSTFSFFAEITRESGADEGFEKEAKKAIRGMPEEIKESWQRIMTEKLDFIKIDLYAFHVLKLYSWSFQIILPNGDLDTKPWLVRPKPGKVRGTSRR